VVLREKRKFIGQVYWIFPLNSFQKTIEKSETAIELFRNPVASGIVSI
jgi:hypothetical protein